MPMMIDLREFPARAEELIALASAGQEIIVTLDGLPRARLIPVSPLGERIAGLHPGAMVPSADFDAPLPEEFWLGQQ